MYRPTQPLMFSWSPDHERPFGYYEVMPSNGSYTRIPDWKKRYAIKKGKNHIPFRFTIGNQVFTGAITDKYLVPRIAEYMSEYYGKKYTNCSSFAHFLTTGTFIECEEEKNLLVLTQGMREYQGEAIRVGDMMCIIYARDRLLRSRKEQHRTKYLRAKKKRHGNSDFRHALSLKHKTPSAKEMEEICQTYLMSDYHFMVCVAKRSEGPVWLSQYGRYVPGDPPPTLVFSIGNSDGYGAEVPLLTLMKRRR